MKPQRMSQTFVFGSATSNENFTDREQEAARLRMNFEHGINTILVSPRRWGKTSLVQKVAIQVNESCENIKVVCMDAFFCRCEEDFYRMFSTEMIRQTASRWEEWAGNVKQFLSRLSPRLNFGVDPVNDFSLSLDLSENLQPEQDILNLPQKIAAAKNIKIIVCIDEFQQISDFSDSKNFQKKLRSVWQLQNDASYCLYGSKMHFLSEIFSKPSMPFYKFGELMYLPKIDTPHWVAYICERFEKTGKNISPEIALKICESVENHSSYVQHLAWLVWSLSNESASDETFNQAYNELLNQNSTLYYRYLENLSGYQLNLLRALADGVETELSTSSVIFKYNLGSSANVVRMRKALEQKELIDITGKRTLIPDPVFKKWLQREMKL